MKKKNLILWSVLVNFIFGTTVFAEQITEKRIVFALEDDNILADAGETNPSSPKLGFNKNHRSLADLILYNKIPGFFKNLDTEAALIGRLYFNSNSNEAQIMHGTSYVNLIYKTESDRAEDGNISFTAFPISSDEFRLGFSHYISWAGDSIFPNQKRVPVPGSKLQINQKGFYAFVGLKTALIDNVVIYEKETSYGLLAGAGLFITDELTFEVNGGYFHKGYNPKPDVFGEPIHSGGVSFQVTYENGVKIGDVVDILLQRSDPSSTKSYFTNQKYSGDLSYYIATEFTYLTQSLQDLDNPLSTKMQPAIAGDINFKIINGYFRINIDAIYRDISFLTFDMKGLFPHQSIPKETKVSPDLYGSIAFDYHVKNLLLTPGLKFSVELPAYYAVDEVPNQIAGEIPSSDLEGRKTYVVPVQGIDAILPKNAEVMPIYTLNLNSKLNISDMLALAGELSFIIDNNRTRLSLDDPRGITTWANDQEYQFQDPYIIGINIVLESRF